MRVADALVTVLRDLDVRFVFGVSGANIEHVHDSVHRLGNGRLRAILATREDGAAFMADARARVHRTLGVCCAASGGGMLNLVAGLAESYAESVPVLALVGQPPTTVDGRGAFQDSSGIGRSVDAVALLTSVTKKVVRVVDPQRFWAELRGAIETALHGRMGPVAVLLPGDSYNLEVGEVPTDWPASLAGFARRHPVDEPAVRTLFRRIRDAASPVLLLGHGVRRSSNPGAVRQFAYQARLPVLTTMGARGEFPNDDPRYLGVLGAGGHPSAAAFLEHGADLAVLVGTGLSVPTRSAVSTWDPERVVAVNIDPGDVIRSSLADTVVRGDAGAVFEQLTTMWEAEPFTAAPVRDYELTRFRPRSEAIGVLERYLPRAGHLVYDAGNRGMAAMLVPPGTTSTIALGMGGTGYAVSGAIGVQLGAPDGVRTMVFCGDDAFLTSGMEIHTAVELALPILYVVFTNGAPVDVTATARGFGAADRLWVGRATTAPELAGALDAYCRSAHLPGVLELATADAVIPPGSGVPGDRWLQAVPPPAATASCRCHG